LLNRSDDRKPVELRHLHIQKQDVGPFALERSHGLAAIGALARNLALRLECEEPAKALPGQSFVVNY